MRVTFQLRFHTNFGESLFITGNHEFFGGGRIENAIPLEYFDDQFWKVTVFIPKTVVPDAEITYEYLLRRSDGSFIQDWGRGRTINLAGLSQDTLVIDSWNDPGAFENAFYSEPFRAVLLKGNQTEIRAPTPRKTTHIFRIKAPLLAKGQTLCLLGESEALGRWNTNRPAVLSRIPSEDWLRLELDLSKETFPITYKYGIYDMEKKVFIQYEEGPNRTLYDTTGVAKQTVVNDGFVRLPASTWKGTGVAIPVFSLRSEKSFGVGEFTDLKLLADWCQLAGLKLIQILPVNDTTANHTWLDSYPYSGISAFALHPLYINLAKVAGDDSNKKLLADIEDERVRLNTLPAVDYQAVMGAKVAFLKRIFPTLKQIAFKSREYKDFFERNKHWLVPYAAFCYLRDKHGTADFNQWPQFKTYNPQEIAKLSSENSPAYEEIAFNYFVQFHLHLQLKEASNYAHSKGVILKGDIPIGVSRFGVDAWQQPNLYCMEMQAGAPPDAFAAKGQNWSFPTYNWEQMAKDGFAWWKQRLGQMGEYFDAFRIDHILGFFRIWSIPVDAIEGILGFFVPALPVRAEEFAGRGIPFERERFVNPYITDSVLSDMFGAEQETVKTQFLENGASWQYRLRAEFATQRQVDKYFSSLEPTEHNLKLKEGLFDLISNVLLFDATDANGGRFHFRIRLENTSSFKSLDPATQTRLNDLYVDYFFRRQDTFWMQQGLEKLPALKRVTNMLVCGEDLGMVPDCVPVVMKQLGLLGLEVQRMPKHLNQQFSRPKDATYLSVVTPGTHDMSTIRGWWKEERHVTQNFFTLELGQRGEAPAECEPWLCKAVILQHLASPAMWAIFQLQDLLGMDAQLRRENPDEERINVPANPKNYWHYRMHVSLEYLIQASDFNNELKACIQQNGR